MHRSSAAAPTVSPWKRCTASALIVVLAVPPLPLWAGPPVPADGRTQVDVSPNGVPVVNIATPNDTGLSHNRYERFDVDRPGLVLNNATQVERSLLAGTLRENANLQGRAASIILNEVVQANRSQLKGYLEVHGQRAELVIANPYGITCDGCGFLNTPRITLSTGLPTFEANGGLGGFQIRQGDILIGRDGADASESAGFDLLTRALRVDGPVWAQALAATTGQFDQTYAGRVTTAVGDGSGAPTVSIDVAALGGMYANRIRLMSTERGVGVAVRGDMAATVDDVVLDAAGRVTLSGRLSAERDILVQASDGVETGRDGASGSDAFVFAGRTLSVDSDGELLLRDGLLGGQASMSLAGSRLVDEGGDTADRYSGGNVQATLDGTASMDGSRWDAGGSLNLQAAGDVALGSSVLVGRSSGVSLAVQGQTVDLSTAQLRGAADVTVAASDTVTQAAGTEAGVAAGRDVRLSAGTAVSLQGGVESGRDLRIDSPALTGGATSWLNAGRDLLSNQSATAVQQAGAQWSAVNTASLQAGSLDLQGQTVARAVDAQASGALSLGDQALVYGVDDVAMAADALTLGSGTVYAERDVALTGRSTVADVGAGLRVAGQAMSLSAGQDLVLAAGQRYDAGSSLSVSAGRDLRLGGSVDPDADGVLLSSAGSIGVTAGRDLTVERHGLVVGSGDLAADAGRRLVLATRDSTAGVQNYALGSGGNMLLQFSELGVDEIFTGAVAAGGDLMFSQRSAGRNGSYLRFANGSRVDAAGTVRAERDDGSAGSTLSVFLEPGAAWVAGGFDLELDRLDLQNGALFTGGTGQSRLRLNQLCSSGIFSADCAQFAGTLVGSARTDLELSGDLVNAGRISNAEVGDPAAGSRLAITTAGSFTNSAAGFVGGSDQLAVTVGDGAAIRNDGLMYSSGNMALLGGAGTEITNGAGATLLMGSARAGAADNQSVIGGLDGSAASMTFRNHGKVEAVGQDLLIRTGRFFNEFAARPATSFRLVSDTMQICPDRLAFCGFGGVAFNSLENPAEVFYPRPLETGSPLSESPTVDRDDQITWNADLRGNFPNQDFGSFPVVRGGNLNYYNGQKAYFVFSFGEVRQDWYRVYTDVEFFTDAAAVAAATPTVSVESGNLTLSVDQGHNQGGLISTTDRLTIQGLTAPATSSFANTSLDLVQRTSRQEIIRKFRCRTDGIGPDACHFRNHLGNSSYLLASSDTLWRDFVRLPDTTVTGVSGTVKARELVATVGSFLNSGTGGGVSSASPLIPDAVGARGLADVGRPTVSASGPAPSSLTLPAGSNGRFVAARNPASGYLVETNPLLISFDNPYLGSDYLMSRLGLKPEQYLLRFGDAAYEAMLIREQIQAQTGAALLRSAYSDYEQQSLLMDNAVAEARRLQLSLGTALSAEQVASLRQDIVWMVATQVEGRTVLVPVVYLTDATRAAGSSTQVLAERAMITADTFTNRGGEVNATSRLQVVSRGNLNNIGGLIGGGNVSLRSLTGSINNVTETQRLGDERNYYTVAGPRGGIVASGNLRLEAAEDINITGADVVSDGRAALIAGRDVNVTALVLETRSERSGTRTGFLNRQTDTRTVTNQSASAARISAGEGVLVDAGRNIDVLGSEVDGGDGLAVLRAQEGDVRIRSIALQSSSSGSSEREGFFAEGRSNSTADASEGTPFSASGFTGYEKSSSSFQSSATTNAGSRVGGAGVAVVATQGSVTLQGSELEAGDQGALVFAGRDVNVVAAYDTSQTTSSASQHRFGISADASTEGVMGGLKTQGGTQQSEERSSTAQTSAIRSEGGISVSAGGTLRREGALFEAAGNIDFTADRIVDMAARNETSTTFSGQTYEAGISAGVTTGLGGTVAGIASGEARQVNISSPQSQVVVGGSGSSYSGGSGSSTAVVTQIRSGGNVTVTARSSILEEGTRYSAAGDVDITAQSYENRAAANTRFSQTDTSSASSSLTVGVNAASEASATITAAGSNEKSGTASSQAVVGGFQAGRNVNIRTTQDLRLEGSGVQAGGAVSLNAGGNLRLDQANDTASTSSSSQSGGATLSASVCLDLTCAGGSVAANARTGESQESSRTGRAVVIQSAGGTTLSAGGNMTLQGTQARAGGNLSLSAGGDIDFQAVSSSTSQTGRADGGGVQAGLNVGKSMNLAKDGGGSASVDFERVRESESTDTRRGGVLQSGGQLSISSGGNTRLEGTQATARTASVNVGGNLLMESAQSTERVDTKNVSGGLSVSGGRNVGSGTGDGAGASSNAAASGSGGKSFGFSAQAEVDLRDKDNLTNQNALLQTTGGTELNVGGNATLAGANIRAGGGVSGEIRGALSVETRTDRVRESATRVDAYVGLSSVNVGGDKDNGADTARPSAGDRFDRRQGQAIDTLNHAGSTGLMLKAESSGTDSQTAAQRSGIDGGAGGLSGLTVRQGANFVGAAPGSDGMNIEGTVTRSEITTFTRNAPTVSIDVRGTVASALGSEEAQGGTISGNLVKGSNLFRDPDNAAPRNVVRGRNDADNDSAPVVRRPVDDASPAAPRRAAGGLTEPPPPLRAPVAADAPVTRPRAGAVGQADVPRPRPADDAAPAQRPRANADAPSVQRPVQAADAAPVTVRPAAGSEAPAPADLPLSRPRAPSGTEPQVGDAASGPAAPGYATATSAYDSVNSAYDTVDSAYAAVPVTTPPGRTAVAVPDADTTAAYSVSGYASTNPDSDAGQVAYAVVSPYSGDAGAPSPEGPQVSQRQLEANAIRPTFTDTRELPNRLIVRDLPVEFRGEDQGVAIKQIKVDRPVTYFSSEERASLEVVVDRQTGRLHLASDPSRTPLNLRGDGTTPPIFVVDADGRMFVHPAPKSGEVHHSSLSGGQPVALAGQVLVKDGFIVHIDNFSGHYQPTTEQLRRTRGYLKQILGANLDQAPQVGVESAWVSDPTGRQVRSVRWIDLTRNEQIAPVDAAQRWTATDQPAQPATVPSSSVQPATAPRRLATGHPSRKRRLRGGCRRASRHGLRRDRVTTRF